DRRQRAGARAPRARRPRLRRADRLARRAADHPSPRALLAARDVHAAAGPPVPDVRARGQGARGREFRRARDGGPVMHAALGLVLILLLAAPAAATAGTARGDASALELAWRRDGVDHYQVIGADARLLDPTLTTPLGSLWKLFVHVYLA